MYIAQGEQTQVNNIPTHVYVQGTNGIVYQQLVYQIPQLTPHLQIVPGVVLQHTSEEIA